MMRNSQRITKVRKTHPPGTLNVCMKHFCIPSDSCWNISVWTKMINQQPNIHAAINAEGGNIWKLSNSPPCFCSGSRFISLVVALFFKTSLHQNLTTTGSQCRVSCSGVTGPSQLDSSWLTVSPATQLVKSPEASVRPRLHGSSPTTNGKIFPLHLQNVSAFTRTTELYTNNWTVGGVSL